MYTAPQQYSFSSMLLLMCCCLFVCCCWVRLSVWIWIFYCCTTDCTQISNELSNYTGRLVEQRVVTCVCDASSTLQRSHAQINLQSLLFLLCQWYEYLYNSRTFPGVSNYQAQHHLEVAVERHLFLLPNWNQNANIFLDVIISDLSSSGYWLLMRLHCLYEYEVGTSIRV